MKTYSTFRGKAKIPYLIHSNTGKYVVIFARIGFSTRDLQDYHCNRIQSFKEGSDSSFSEPSLDYREKFNLNQNLWEFDEEYRAIQKMKELWNKIKVKTD